MKYYFAILLFFLIQPCCYSQNNGIISYNLTLNNENKKMTLEFNDTSSICIYNKEGWDTNYSSYSNSLYNDTLGLGIKVSQYDSIGHVIYRNFNKKNIKIRQPKVGILDAFTVFDDWIPIKWKHTDDTKIINGYTCKMAIGDFRGRQYIAWYATELKGGFGPWKLYGLPGIILEAYDKQNEVRFIVTNISIVDTILNISEPVETNSKTLKEYVYYLDHTGRLAYKKLKTKELPKGVRIGNIRKETSVKEVREKSLEKIYEWEAIKHIEKKKQINSTISMPKY